MNYIKIIETSSYLPEEKISSSEIEEKLKLEKGYIEKRTGIKQRYYAKEEITNMAIKVAQNIINKTTIEKQKIGLVITATTSSKKLMPRNIKRNSKKSKAKQLYMFRYTSRL